ncbi:DMT family transporter [Natranaerobius thermophilus]|uniref:EamA domain-containing protein n=1 Tax=Natranaerobius thermophilus (strain ATCC BAA-1301 / DSM 18059 / JW/NM-WN-LF) TaxID=457570 RepID=B2A3E3_NATTJ|nr:EamA family transporter [Natranaerobius thermophilus]ACB86372.1 protein of unknown function DUF6 transmembrane [Natranaerobius thermophilus JW/NM-WN-LF]
MFFQSGYFKILISACIWGTVGIFARWSAMPATDLAFYKTLFACLFLLSILPREDLLITNKFKAYMVIFLTGILYALNAILFLSSIYLTTLSNSLFAYYTKPVIVAFLAPFFFRETPEFRNILAIVISLVGLALILTPSVVSISTQDLAGIALGLCAAISASLVVILVKLVQLPAPIVVYYKMVVAILIMLPLVNFQANFHHGQIFIAAIIGVIHTVLPYILYYSGMQVVKASYGITLTYFDPVVASFLGVLIFGEELTYLSLIGGILIISSGAIIMRH